MRFTPRVRFPVYFLVVVMLCPAFAAAEGEILELSCPSCGYRERFVQGSEGTEEGRNVQQIIVVCERNRQIRNIKIAIDPQVPVNGEPLLARQYGSGQSEMLGRKLPKFLVPGNTCPLYPITAYLEQDVCPVDGKPGFSFQVVGYF